MKKFLIVVILYQNISNYIMKIYLRDIWDYNLGETTIGELAKEDVIDTIIERKIIKKQWENYALLSQKKMKLR